MTAATAPKTTLREQIRQSLKSNEKGLTGAEIVKEINYQAAQKGPVYRAIRQLVDEGLASNKDAKRTAGEGEAAKTKEVRVTVLTAKGKNYDPQKVAEAAAKKKAAEDKKKADAAAKAKAETAAAKASAPEASNGTSGNTEGVTITPQTTEA